MLTVPPTVLALLVVAITALAAVTDVRTGLIPNRLTLGGLLSVLALQTLLVSFDHGPRLLPGALLASLLGALACGLIPLGIYLAGGLGGGDLKLLALCGVGLGPLLGLEAELYAFGLGCLYAIGRAAYGGVLWRTLRGSTTLLANAVVPTHARREVAPSVLVPVRFAPFIFAGVATAVVSHWRLT
jgi:prepilin peptidase CpaA